MQQVSAALFLLALCAAAIAADDEDHAIHIPEPMDFDLVHGLGVEQGTFEAKALVLYDKGD